MKIDDAISILQGNIQALDQGVDLIESLTDEQYCFVALPYVKSTIGQHFRHVIDMFQAVILLSPVIDYDKRRRGASVETSRPTAVKEILHVKSWMSEQIGNIPNSIEQFSADIHIQSEVTIENTQSVSVPSTLLRELVFASSHAVHHYALISVIAKLQGVVLDESLGIAPATATFLRNQGSGLDVSENAPSCAQ